MADVARNIAIFRAAVEATGERWDAMRVGVTRAFFVTDDIREREEALERRLAKRLRQLKLARTPDGRVLGGLDRADGDPIEINLTSAMYGPPDEIARKIEALRDPGAGYLLLNGGGSGGGERGRQSLRRFAREVMPFARTFSIVKHKFATDSSFRRDAGIEADLRLGLAFAPGRRFSARTNESAH